MGSLGMIRNSGMPWMTMATTRCSLGLRMRPCIWRNRPRRCQRSRRRGDGRRHALASMLRAPRGKRSPTRSATRSSRRAVSARARKGGNGGKSRSWRGIRGQGEEATARHERLLIRRNLEGLDRKYSVTPDRHHPSRWEELRDQQMQRLGVEQRLKDAQREVGMAEYQGRTWRAWHPHLTLTMRAVRFMLHQKAHHQEETPWLSCADIRVMLAQTLPQRVVSNDDVLEVITPRHQRRPYDLDRYA